MAAVNVAAAQWLSVGAWGLVVTGLLIAKLVFFGAQYLVLKLSVRARMRAAAV